MQPRKERTALTPPPHDVVHHAALTQPRRIAQEWFAVLGAPVAWALAFGLDYGFVEVACGYRSPLVIHLANLLGLLVAAAAFLLAWRLWALTGREHPGEWYGPLPRSRLMALLGLLSGVLFGVAIVAQWLPVFVLNPCMGV